VPGTCSSSDALTRSVVDDACSTCLDSHRLLIRIHTHRSFSPALSLSILSPKLSWSEDETKAGVQRGFTVTHPDGTGFTPYDLKRLQARRLSLHIDVQEMFPDRSIAYVTSRLPPRPDASGGCQYKLQQFESISILKVVGYYQKKKKNMLEHVSGLPSCNPDSVCSGKVFCLRSSRI